MRRTTTRKDQGFLIGDTSARNRNGNCGQRAQSRPNRSDPSAHESKHSATADVRLSAGSNRPDRGNRGLRSGTLTAGYLAQPAADPGADLTEFVDSWLGWFADAAERSLHHPSPLPEKPGNGGFRGA